MSRLKGLSAQLRDVFRGNEAEAECKRNFSSSRNSYEWYKDP